MAEEVKDVVVDTPPPVNPEEQRATEDGWQPLEQWTAAGNDATSHRSAREFNDRGELLRKITEQNKYIQRTNEGISELREHNRRVYESAYTKAITDLKAQHTAAVEAGELAKADKLVDQIADTKATAAANQVSQRAAQAQTTVPELEVWRERNKWYDEDEDARIFADAVADRFVKERRGMVSPTEVLKHVETKVKAKLMKPEPKVAAPNPVAGSGISPTKAAAAKTVGLKKSDLEEYELKAMRAFVSNKLGKEEDYLQQLSDIR